MKLYYFFCDTPLGFLTKTEKGYAYTSNIDNEQKFRDHTAVSCEYSLWGSLNRESRELFPEMERILRECSRKDIQERAGISPQDSKWDRLVKLSRLSFYPAGFYVSINEKCDGRPA